MGSFSSFECMKDLLFYMEMPEDFNYSIKTRKKEIKKITANIFKRQNRKILLWGNFGIGKSTLVKQTFWYIHSGNINGDFEDIKFVMLDIPTLVSKQSERLNKIFSELINYFEKNPKLVLIIENFENLLMGVDTEIKLELRKLLTNPKISVIATADIDETIIKNNSIYNLFEKIHLEEPVIDDVYGVIKPQIAEIAKNHNVIISRKMAMWLINVSIIFSDVSMPKRCIDLIDEVSSYAKLNGIKHVSKNTFFKCNEFHFEKFLHLSETQKRNIAIHELGHYFVHKASTNFSFTPFLVSIVPVDLFDGATYLIELPNFVETVDEKYYVSLIGAALAGKIAEEIFNIPLNSGASADLIEANEQAALYSSSLGMNPLLNDKIIVEDQTELVDEDCKQDIAYTQNYILEKARVYAEEIIHKNELYFDAIITELVKNYGILTSYEIEEILKKNQRK